MAAGGTITRAIERTVLASRCLVGASDDLRAYARNGGLAGQAAADLLRDQALTLEQIAQTIDELRA
ncbi:MAG: hypothetical protein E6G34_02950 [Actinobacteria bacterium]|nr:MAG: hypothetical protein E6G34_02950 [Actinomycetota bacterium]